MERPGKVGRALAADPAAAARLRGQRPGALLGPHRTLPAGRRRGQHPGGEPLHRRAVLPPAAQAGAQRPAAPADHLHAEEHAAHEGRLVHPGGLADGHFQSVIDDPYGSASGANRMAVKRLILCAGKIAHELEGDQRARAATTSRSPGSSCSTRPGGRHPRDDRLVPEPRAGSTWVQEEPRNMGAWERMHRELSRTLPHGVRLEYVGRARRASSSEGYPKAHQTEQERVLAAAFDQGSATRVTTDGGAARVVVLGGGPAGDVAALRAAQLGADGTLIERAELGGTCSTAAASPPRPCWRPPTCCASSAAPTSSAAGRRGRLRLPEDDGPQGGDRPEDAPGGRGRGQAQGREGRLRPGDRRRRRGRGRRRALPLRPPDRLRRHRALGPARLRHGPPGGDDLRRRAAARGGAREHADRRRRRDRLRVRQPVRPARQRDHGRRDPPAPARRRGQPHRLPVPAAAGEGGRQGAPRPPGRRGRRVPRGRGHGPPRRRHDHHGREAARVGRPPLAGRRHRPAGGRRRGDRARPRGGRRVPAHRQPEGLGGRRLHRRAPAGAPGLGRGGPRGRERAGRQAAADGPHRGPELHLHPPRDRHRRPERRRRRGGRPPGQDRAGALRRVGQGARRGRARRLRAARLGRRRPACCSAPRSWACTPSR